MVMNTKGEIKKKDSQENQCGYPEKIQCHHTSVFPVPVWFLLNTFGKAYAVPLTLYNPPFYKTMTGTVVRAYVTANRQRM